MTPGQYVDVLRNGWRKVLAGLVLGLAAAALVTMLTPRQYTSDAVIFVTARAGTDLATAVDGTDLSTQRMATYVEVLRSQKIAQEVGADPGIRLTAAEVGDKISVSTVTGTFLLTATVTDDSPARAAQIANLAAARFIDAVGQLERPSDPAAAPLVRAEVFAPATPNPDPVSPSATLNLAVGAAIGLLAGFGFALLRRSLDATVTARQQVEDVLTLPVLGSIGYDPRMRKSPLVMFGAPNGQPAEGFRKLRTNLQSVGDAAPRIVLVAGPSAGEGRTTIVCNLGIASAEAGLRVLLIDSDLRAPGVTSRMLVDGDVGLADVLEGRVSAVGAIRAAGPGLDVLPSGLMPQNPSEMLGSDRMDGLIDEVRRAYDLVLLDSPPLLPVADAAVLARRADGVLLAVRHGRTTIAQVRASRDALNAVAARVLGSVLTMVPAEPGIRRALRERFASSAGTAQGDPPPEPVPSPRSPDDDGRSALVGGDGPLLGPHPAVGATTDPPRSGDQTQR